MRKFLFYFFILFFYFVTIQPPKKLRVNFLIFTLTSFVYFKIFEILKLYFLKFYAHFVRVFSNKFENRRY